MNQTKSVLRDLEEAIARGTAESRTRALWHTTDLLIAGRYCDEDVATFGEVIDRLADEIELVARAQLAQRMARIDNAPINVIRKLAFDDAIEVAGPVLRDSERLDNDALVANASVKSQAHLLAISQRKSIAEDVTDVLVERGNREVVRRRALLGRGLPAHDQTRRGRFDPRRASRPARGHPPAAVSAADRQGFQ